MALPTDLCEELLERIDAMREGLLSVKGETELNQSVVDDEEVRTFYVEYVDLCALVEQSGGVLRAHSFISSPT